MKTIISLLCTILITSSLYGSEGKAFFQEANCGSCHGGDNMFDRMNKKVKNLHDLNGWVSMCATNLNTGWFPEEEKEVVKYLNETYYKLGK